MLKGIIKGLVGNASEILDTVITTDEERLEAKRKIKELKETNRKLREKLSELDYKKANQEWVEND